MKILEFLRTRKFPKEKVLDFFRKIKFSKKGFLDFFGTKTTIRNEYIDSIINIKQGDISARKDFTDRHKSFILETISHSLGRSAVPKNSPEFDIGLDAFDHSIEMFNPDKDNDFLSFSEQIIREWVLSYLREENSNNMRGQIDEEKYYLYSNYESTKDISQFKMNLWEYGIKIGELPYMSPDEKQNIGVCLRIAKKLSTDSALFQKVAKDNNLSLEDFADGIKLDKKIFNKHKKYIIALTLILKNNLKLLCSYLKNLNLRNDFSENIGVILEINKGQAVLFTLQGEFLSIKLSKFGKVGEQIKFGSYRVQKKNRYQKYVVGAWAVTSILIVFLLFNGLRIILNNDKPAVAYNIEETPLPTEKPVFSPSPQKTSAFLAIEPTSSELPATNPVSTKAPSSPTPTESYSVAAASPTKSNNASPVSTTVVTKANAKPDEARISAKPLKVKVGEKYEVHFYMKYGNNGTTLILYQNEREYKRFDLVDKTPINQARILSFTAAVPGTNSYRWELINEFGTTSSKTITVTVLE